MEFTIDRTSLCGENTSPCENARQRVDFDDEWTITISSLEELMSFVKRYRRIVMTENSIEIYDDWRE